MSINQDIKVSIIVPVYNVEKYLSECINSLINQTYKNIEIILVDDGSTDNSGAISDEFAKADDRIIVYHIENRGVSAARNLALSKLTGEYVTFVDSDDWVDEEYIEYLLTGIVENKVEIAMCNHYRYFTNGEIKIMLKYKERVVNQDKALNPFSKYYISYSCTTLFKMNDSLRFDENSKVGEDLIYRTKYIMNSSKMYAGDKPLYYYRIHPNSTIQSMTFEKHYNEYLTWLKILDLVKYNKRIYRKRMKRCVKKTQKVLKNPNYIQADMEKRMELERFCRKNILYRYFITKF